MIIRKALAPSAVILFAAVAGILGSEGGGPQVIPLWKNGPPGHESRKNEKEIVKYKGEMEIDVKNVHNPSITVYLPAKEKATGTSLIILPGGSHKHLVIEGEGHLVGKWCAENGIAGIVLKYRLMRDDNSPYKSLLKEPLDDTHRAIRMTRYHAKDWSLDKSKVGIIGFSAGGELVGYAVTNNDAGKADAPDPIDRESCRPDFQVLIYPGPLGVTKDLGKPLTKDLHIPPTFIAVGDLDGGAPNMADHYKALRKAGVSVEMHIFADTKHGFTMALDPTLPRSTKAWLTRLKDWMIDKKVLNP